MTKSQLSFAREDCQRFIDRTKPILESADRGPVDEQELRKVRNLSLDVTRSLIELRKSIDAAMAKPEPAPFAVSAGL